MKLSSPVLEGLKEFIRTVVLGEIPVLIGVLSIVKSGIDIEVGGFKVNGLLALAVFVSGTISVIQTALMSGLDKWLHKSDVKTVLDLTSMDTLKQ